jgi:hypothetical protein
MFCNGNSSEHCDDTKKEQITVTQEMYDNMTPEEQEEYEFQVDKKEWEGLCTVGEGDSYNTTDTEPLKLKLLKMVDGDPVAIGAMDLFLKSLFWQFVDYCEDKLSSMIPINYERFREILILLGPGIYAERYEKKIISLIGDKDNVRKTGIKHLEFCLDMFSYGALDNARKGIVPIVAMCKNAFYNVTSNEQIEKQCAQYEAIRAIYRGVCFDDCPRIMYWPTHIWPNWNK